MSESKAWIAAPSGQRLTADERAFFAGEQPWGFILFGRNISEPNQISDLVSELKEIGGRASTPIFIDQEGGRIHRLRPPLAPNYPPPSNLGLVYAVDPDAGERAAWLQGRLLAADIMSFGINADCIPCLDVPIEGAHSVIGDRAFSHDPRTVAVLGRAQSEGLMAGGALPVMKHIPGHGRGLADSHLELPVVHTRRSELAVSDFAPFGALHTLPAAMTAHMLYSAIDPKLPATLSPVIIEQIIRGDIGFDGLLMTDDMSMRALEGDIGANSRAALDAGCDVVLHCNGRMEEMRRVAAVAPELLGEARRRAAEAEAVIAEGADTSDVAALRQEYEEMVAQLA